MAVDAILCVLAVWVAFYLRLDAWMPFHGSMIFAAASSLILALLILYYFGIYRSIYRFIGWHAVVSVSQAAFVYSVLYIMIFTIMGIPGVPRTIGLIQPLLLFFGVGLSRFFVGYWLGGAHRTKPKGAKGINVLIYGSGAAGQQLATAIAQSDTLNVVGFVDDHSGLQGGILNNLRVYGPDQIPELIDTFDVSEILLALPSVSRVRRNEIVKSLLGLDVQVRTLPGIMDIAHGHVQITDIKPLEIEDLLGRDAVAPDMILLGRNITGETVLVTGAGGSIGSELCRQIAALAPSALLLVESSEYALYAVHQNLVNQYTEENRDLSIVPLLASVCDESRMREIISTWQPQTIYHAAAYKHVPLVEHNPSEGIRNNLFGTMTTACLAKEFGVSNFVLISTDKAVRPTNIMGTTKRLAEMVLQSLAEDGAGTCFSMVRFGNVLGSSGSVVPLFRRQIAEGGPVTITHQEITRYFMTVSEAAQLVIQAGAMAEGGEVFVLDMGEPVRIIDLARNMIELSGMTVRDADNPDGDVEIKVVGLRPGEKLYEELLIGDNPQPTSHPRILKASEHFFGWGELNRHLTKLSGALDANDLATIMPILHALVPEYRPKGALVDWIILKRSETNPSQTAEAPRLRTRKTG